MKLRRHSDNLVQLLGPVNRGADPVAAITSATVTARVFDTSKDVPLLEDETSGTSFLKVPNVQRFAAGQTIRVEQDNGVFHETTINSITSTGSLSLAAALTNQASQGSRVAIKLGANVTLSAFNSSNAVVDRFDWGFQGTIESDHADLRRGQRVRIEIELDDGSNRRSVEYFEADVVGPGE